MTHRLWCVPHVVLHGWWSEHWASALCVCRQLATLVGSCHLPLPEGNLFQSASRLTGSRGPKQRLAPSAPQTSDPLTPRDP